MYIEEMGTVLFLMMLQLCLLRSAGVGGVCCLSREGWGVLQSHREGCVCVAYHVVPYC